MVNLNHKRQKADITHDFVREFKEYFDIKESYRWDDNAKKYMPIKMPSLIGFAREQGILERTLRRYLAKGAKLKYKDVKDDDHFIRYWRLARIYEEWKSIQKEHIVHLGISGVTPSGAYIFTAINYTDMRAKNETDLTSGGKPVSLVALHERLENYSA